MPAVFTLVNLSEVLSRRWFRAPKFDLDFYSEEPHPYSMGDSRVSMSRLRLRKIYSPALSLVDILQIAGGEDYVRLEYQLRERAAKAESYLGKRPPTRPDASLEPSPKVTPNHIKKEASSVNYAQSIHDDDYLGFQDDLENTNFFSLIRGAGENSLLSGLGLGNQFQTFEGERSNFHDIASLDAEKSRKARPAQKGGNSVLQIVEGDSRQTFVIRPKEEAPASFARIKEDSVRLEASSDSMEPVSSPAPKQDKKQLSARASEVSFEQQVQMLREKVELVAPSAAAFTGFPGNPLVREIK